MRTWTRFGALLLTFLVPALGYIYLGPFFAGLFLLGYVSGYMLWLLTSTSPGWPRIRSPYWWTLCAFLLVHKVEENRTAFFEEVSARITKTPVPPVTPGLVVALLVIPIGSWLIIPWLVRRNLEFGRYLAWTFFAAMGITELGHFAMPFLAGEAFGYFPGMASAVLLAPLAWWGIYRMLRS